MVCWFCLGPRHKGDIALGQPPYSKMSDFPSSETSAEQKTTTNHTKTTSDRTINVWVCTSGMDNPK